MGKVVIYLPAEFERKLREDGHDPAEWVRAEVKKLVLDEGGLRRKVILHDVVDLHFKPDPK